MNWFRSIIGKPPPKNNPVVDRKVVTRMYKETLVPLLKCNGFEYFGFSAPTKNPAAWRRQGKWVDTFELFFLKPEERRKLATNAVSISVVVGRHFLFVPYKRAELPRSPTGLPLPYSIACELVYSPKKSIKQREINASTVWCVDCDGENLGRVMDDVRRALTNDAFVWLSQWDDLGVLLGRLQEERNVDSPLVWQGFGRWGSPIRDFLIGFTALELGQFELAISHLRLALDSNAFGVDDRMPMKYVLEDQLVAAIAKAEALLHEPKGL